MRTREAERSRVRRAECSTRPLGVRQLADESDDQRTGHRTDHHPSDDPVAPPEAFPRPGVLHVLVADQVGVDEHDGADDDEYQHRRDPVCSRLKLLREDEVRDDETRKDNAGDHPQSVAPITGVGTGFLVDDENERDDRAGHHQGDDHGAEVVRDGIRLLGGRRQDLAATGRFGNADRDERHKECERARQVQQHIFGVVTALVDDQHDAEATQCRDEDIARSGVVVRADRPLPAVGGHAVDEYRREEHDDDDDHAGSSGTDRCLVRCVPIHRMGRSWCSRECVCLPADSNAAIGS